MKASKPGILILIVTSMFTFCIISGCGKDDSEEDWATPLAGTYTHQYTFSGTSNLVVTTITVRRKDNKRVSIQINRDDFASFVAPLDVCLDSVMLTSEFHCSFNEVDSCTTDGLGIPDVILGIGSGEFTPNSLELNYKRVYVGLQDTFPDHWIAIK